MLVGTSLGSLPCLTIRNRLPSADTSYERETPNSRSAIRIQPSISLVGAPAVHVVPRTTGTLMSAPVDAR